MGIKDKSQGLEDETMDTISILSSSVDQLSVGSSEDLNMVENPRTWNQQFESIVDELLEVRKVGSKEREGHLRKLYNLCTRYYVKRVAEKIGPLEEILLKLFHSSRSDAEVIITMRLLCALCLASVFSVEGLWTATEGRFNALVNDAQSTAVKCEAMLSLSLLTVLLDSEPDIIDFGYQLASIIESDGAVVNAEDNEDVVGIACQSLGLLLTGITSYSEFVSSAAEALAEQLEAASIDVQMGAGQALAALYERITDTHSEEENGKGSIDNDIFPDRIHLLSILRDLSTESSKSIAKKHRKVLHQTFRNVLQTIENPRSSGNLRSSMRIGKSTVQLDTWKKILRAQSLKYILRSAFPVYFAKSSFLRNFMDYSGYVAGIAMSDSESDNEEEEAENYIDDQKRGLTGAERREKDRVRDRQRRQEQRNRTDFVNSYYFS
ncbi:eukaryotic protein [Schizosaccharomyces cryophilus OY26]|uniref:Eukaryotic protein n=1 Tax=Schizosaccharomyces cryophilus (strain OY26 / ATCC MYA-4695 / CBS 11777 / NBRC 106824 / NRRL Y48691) TaxID=653667 RepID=S9X0Z1_SCHCR|nr:uncharacterized protein SPOG_00776 [Schizosaccharomyces cryophilus OY26]EPY50682.1 eukaryotic protein [Schizosaccharomyces cryophilus OY26]